MVDWRHKTGEELKELLEKLEKVVDKQRKDPTDLPTAPRLWAVSTGWYESFKAFVEGSSKVSFALQFYCLLGSYD